MFLNLHIICIISTMRNRKGGSMAMAHQSITATELVRNLSGVIDQVRISGKSLLIKKGTQTVAELRPPPKVGIPVTKLGEWFDSLPKLGNEKTPMSQDLASLRKKAVLPKSSWD